MLLVLQSDTEAIDQAATSHTVSTVVFTNRTVGSL